MELVQLQQKRHRVSTLLTIHLICDVLIGCQCTALRVPSIKAHVSASSLWDTTQGNFVGARGQHSLILIALKA